MPDYRAKFVDRIGRNRMYYTLTTAAKATGLDASEILRAIESGQITGSRGEFGEWRVEIAELTAFIPQLQSRALTAT